MDSRELRIGNLIDYTGNYRFNGVFDNEFARYMFDIRDEWDLIKPIPLTEEWLLKLGFEYEFDDDRFVFDTNIPSGLSMIYFIENGIIFYFNNDIKEWIEIPIIIKYVHQLQNLYFAIKGEELTINP